MPLPWKEVNAADSQSVARLIGLEKAREVRKWACPFCGSSDALHAYSGPGAGFGCWAACGADRPKGCRGYSNLDVAMGLWGEAAADACRRLAGLLGLVWDDDHGRGLRPFPRVLPVPPAVAAPSRQERNLAAVRGLPGARLPPAVYADVAARLRLGRRGEAYLARRRLDPRPAEAAGYRSVEGPRSWAGLAAHLARSYGAEELAAAGFPLDEEGAVTLPFGGRLPALLIPFRRGGELVGMRFRSLLPDSPASKHNRYRTLVAARPPWPYEADALRLPTVHVVEGELNAETLRQLGVPAAGLYGAGAWLDEWTLELAEARLVVAWYDCRDRRRAGDLGAAALRGRLEAAFGEEWVARRWRRMITEQDPNALHQQGRLGAILRARPWAGAPGAEVRAA